MTRGNIKDDFIDKIIEGSEDVEKCFIVGRYAEQINYGGIIEKNGLVELPVGKHTFDTYLKY